MELHGACSNPRLQLELSRLGSLHQGLLSRELDAPRPARPLGRRQGFVRDLIIRVLATADAPMRPREVHAAAELLAGAPLAWSTVKNCLAANATGSAPRFERLARGRYRLPS